MPVIEKGYVPGASEVVVEMVIVVVPLAPAEAGLNEGVAPVGRPVVPYVTVEL